MRRPLEQQAIAILHQALRPPVIDGRRKEAKPGGYSDSGADIGFCLRDLGLNLLTPRASPDPRVDRDWVFPDTEAGIADAVGRGATVLWANTVVFSGHPIEQWMDRCCIVGQLPAAMQAADDKFATNVRLRAEGLPVARSLLVGGEARSGVHALAALSVETLAALGLTFPLIVKPVRGRGSQGVEWVGDLEDLVRTASALMASGRFGDEVILEQFLSGAELTVTVMPEGRGETDPSGGHRFWALPPVLRFNHEKGVAPYNGAVAVTRNSRALAPEEQQTREVRELIDACIAAAGIVGARAPIRIDCRADPEGVFRLFDLNMKPNMTGAGRPGREEQDSLSLLAARAIGWNYGELLKAMLGNAWCQPGA